MAQIPTGQIPGWDQPHGVEDHLVAQRSSGWESWVTFGGSLITVVGIFNLIDGFVALTSEEVFVVRQQELLVLNFTAWGWLLVALGIIQAAAGIGILRGQTWARVVGVIVAVVNAIAQLAFIDAFPFWSVLIIVMDIFIIFAITVHGRELAR